MAADRVPGKANGGIVLPAEDGAFANEWKRSSGFGALDSEQSSHSHGLMVLTTASMIRENALRCKVPATETARILYFRLKWRPCRILLGTIPILSHSCFAQK